MLFKSFISRKSIFGNVRRANRRRRSSFSDCGATAEALEVRALLSGATFVVTTLADDGTGSLRDAIDQANDTPGADTIQFADDVQGTIGLSEQLLITDDLTIDGPGAGKLTVSGTILDDAGNPISTRVFGVIPPALADTPNVAPTLEQLESAPTVTIEGLTIADGVATDALGFDPGSGFVFGGGLYNLGSTVFLDHVHMTGNQATGPVTAGGAIANEFGGRLTISHSHFEGNLSTGLLIAVGGAVTSDLGPAADGTTEQPVVQIDSSSFVNNVAEAAFGYDNTAAFSGMGGGGAILNVTGVMSIRNSHFEGNVAQGGAGAVTSGGPGFGGAILTGDISPFGEADSSLTVEGSTFVGNTAAGGVGAESGVPGGLGTGGAINIGNAGDAILSRNHFEGNAALGGNATDNADGGVGSGGGVVATGEAEVSLDRNVFTDNLADGGDGAGTGQGASGRGGGLSIDSKDLLGFNPGEASATSSQDTFEGNTASGGIGGAIYNSGELTIQRATLTGNQAIAEPDVLIDFVPGYVFVGAALGGGISNLGTLEMTQTTLESNGAYGADGAVGPIGEPVAKYPGIAVGGGLHNISTATVTRTEFVSNEALAGNGNTGTFAGVANGGGIYNDGSLELRQSTVEGNVSAGGNDNFGDLNVGAGYGGGLTSGSVTPLGDGNATGASLIVDRSSFVGNTAAGGDGNASVVPDEFLPLAHVAGGANGGGILVYQGTAEISRATITGNSSIGGEGGSGVGGGVFFLSFIGSLDATLSRSFVSNNVAIGGDGRPGLAGGVGAGSLDSLFGGETTLTVYRTTVAGNQAIGGAGGDGLGGGIYNDNDSTLTLKRSSVYGNRAEGGNGGDGIGGGIFNNGGELFKIRAQVFANFATTSDNDCFGCID